MISRAEIDTIASLVTERPDHDRRVVLASLEHPPSSIEVMRHPVRLVAEGLVEIVSVAVALDVGLVDDVETVLTRQLVPPFRLRVVRVTHGVHVGRFHQPDIRQHRCLVNDVTLDVMVLVQVDAFESDVSAVDQEAAVDDLDRAETERLGDRLAAVDRDQQGVQIRLLGRPCVDAAERRSEYVT